MDESRVVPVVAEELTSTDLVILTNDDEEKKPGIWEQPKDAIRCSWARGRGAL